METIDFGLFDYLLLSLLILIPGVIIIYLRLSLLKTMLTGIARMIIQLTLVGLYLNIIFELNSWLLNFAWIIVMLLIANYTIISRAGLKNSVFFWSTLLGTAAGSLAVSVYFVLMIIEPNPLYDARYLIPVFGMVLGNCMRGNVLSLERFYYGIKDREEDFITFQMLGATNAEACRPFMEQAIRTSIGPQLSSIATMGIVSLPGMMTGQILGGSFPITAIKYQIAIIICILSAQMLSSVLNIQLSRSSAFNNMGMLDHRIFSNRQ